MRKRIPVLVVGSCLLWLAYQARDVLMEMVWIATSTYSHSKIADFEVGTGRTLTLEMPRSFIPKPYGVALRTEFPGVETITEATSKNNYPKKFKINIYKKSFFSNQKRIVLTKSFENGDRGFGGTLFNSLSNNITFSDYIYATTLPPGKYIFEIKDETLRSREHDQIKTHLQIILKTQF